MEVSAECKTLFPLNRILPLIILIEGFISIAIEILTIRQLLPVAGGSVIVTSLIIGIFLLFLALGYQQGGKPRTNPQQVLRKNFFIASLWLGIGLSYLFVGLFFHFIQKMTGPHVVYPLLAYLLLIIAPLIFILGQTVPITMNMAKQNKTAGKIGGNTLGLSTLGSFLGAIVTTLIFMYYWGIAWTILINFMLLLGLTLLLADDVLTFLFQLCMAVIAMSVIYNLNVKIETLFFDLTDNYANYHIQDHTNSSLLPGEKVLMINEARSSYINPENKGYPYAEIIKKILFSELHLRDANILVLGAGGFSLSAEGSFSNHFTYVDIDPQIKNVTVPRFIKKLNSDLIVDDARHYLQSGSSLYQVIILDAYNDTKSVPAHLLTLEYMRTVKNRLAPNGLAIFNILANPTLADPYSKRIDNTIRAVFHNCMTHPIAYKNSVTNILYLCHNASNQEDPRIYSDNLNNSTTDSFSW